MRRRPGGVMIAALHKPAVQSRMAFLKSMGWMEVFVCSQFLLSGIMLFPGTQPVRLFIRTVPYLSCIFFLLVYHSRIKRIKLPPASSLILLAVALLAVNLLNPGTVPVAGLAQLVFQICIAAPLYWAVGMVESPARLKR